MSLSDRLLEAARTVLPNFEPRRPALPDLPSLRQWAASLRERLAALWAAWVALDLPPLLVAELVLLVVVVAWATVLLMQAASGDPRPW